MNRSLWRIFGKGRQDGLRLIRLFGIYETDVGFQSPPFLKGDFRGILVDPLKIPLALLYQRGESVVNLGPMG